MIGRRKSGGVYTATYKFAAITDKKGWTISGTYTVLTAQRGALNTVQIEAIIVAPHVLKKQNIFTVGFLFPYGKNQKRTEAFLVKKSTVFNFIASEWKTQSAASKNSLGYVKKYPTLSMIF